MFCDSTFKHPIFVSLKFASILKIANHYEIFPNLFTCIRVNYTGTTDIRIFGGTSSSGTVEVLYNGAWSTVCGNNWDINDAHAACRQLHFERAESIFSNGTFGYGSEPGSYELSNFRCGGSEKRLLDCSSTTNTVCQHSQDAGVKCEIGKSKIKINLVTISTSCSLT